MSLRLDSSIQKFLISTTSSLGGEYLSDSLLVEHSLNSNPNGLTRCTPGAASRNSYIIVFRTRPIKPIAGLVVPNFSNTADFFANLLSLLFGKRFDNHGFIEHVGMYEVPELSAFSTLCNPQLPFNSYDARVDYSVELNLIQLRRFDNIIHGQVESEFTHVFQAALKFYAQALRFAERDWESAYLSLITAGEILSNFAQFEKNDVLDEEEKSMLSEIRHKLENGEEVVRKLEKRMLAIKRRFILSITQRVKSDFFERSESKNASFQMRNFEKGIGAAYDLRSKYLHTGATFGHWVKPWGGGNDEVQIGEPQVEDKDFGKILAKAPTFVGLERVVRYCLLSFAKENDALSEL